MTVYKKVLLELNKESTLKSKHNNLMKLFYTTEDDYLKDCIRQYCKYLKQAVHYIQNKMPGQAKDAIDNSFRPMVALSNYCNQMIECEKPEWQVIAERNGWGPLR